MNSPKTLCIVLLLLAACNPNPRDDVWSNYDWLPDEAEGNPYSLPPQSRGGYAPQPYYDNDSTYVPPRNFGFCAQGSTIGCE